MLYSESVGATFTFAPVFKGKWETADAVSAGKNN